MISAPRLANIQTGLVAGAAGGLAEIAWVTLYAGLTGADPALVARGVTTAAGVSALLPDASPVVLGIGVHMTLAAMLGVVLACAWQALRARDPRLSNPYPLMMLALAGVWATNFFVVLPLVSQAFIHVVPYAVSLTSKLLFAAAAAEVFRYAAIGAGPAIVPLPIASCSYSMSLMPSCPSVCYCQARQSYGRPLGPSVPACTPGWRGPRA